MTKFNPNDLNKLGMWATYIPTRKPAFKVHNGRGQALCALKNQSRHVANYTAYEIPSDCTLWMHDGTEWKEIQFKHLYIKKESLL